MSDKPNNPKDKPSNKNNSENDKGKLKFNWWMIYALVLGVFFFISINSNE